MEFVRLNIFLVYFCCCLSLNVAKWATDNSVKHFDDVLTETNLNELTNFVSDDLMWKQRSLFESDLRNSKDQLVWHTASFQDVLFSELQSWKYLKELTNSLFHNETEASSEIWASHVQARVLQRGDVSPLERIAKSGLCTVLVLACENWQKNSYGELVFYDNDDKYITGIHPKHGRVVVTRHGGDVASYVVKPPSLDTRHNIMVISFEISSDSKAMLVSEVAPLYNDIKFRMSRRNSFVLPSPTSSNTWNLTALISKQFQTKRGEKIIVFDDVFTQNELQQFLEKIDSGLYQYSPPTEDSSDNVLWILGLETPNFIESDLWSVIRAILNVTTGSDLYYPYDVSCNNIQTWHNPTIHQDTEEVDEEDYTLLVYLTPEWKESFYGETVFYDEDEIFAVVRPKLGRVVVFRGTIWHAARPPSPGFRGPRYTFAVKCSPTKERALRKSRIYSTDNLSSFNEELVGREKAEEIREFGRELTDEQGDDDEMERLGEVQE